MKPPDLVITSVDFDPTRGQVLVTVQNQGEGVLEDRTVGLVERTLDGGPEAPPVQYPLTSLAPRESTVLTMAADESLHSQWFRGYQVTVDPERLIAESDDGNNTFTVVGGGYVRVAWTHMAAPWQARNLVDFELRATIVSAGSRREVARWHVGQDIDWNTCSHDASNGQCTKLYQVETPFDTDAFAIAGDEALEIAVHIGNERALTDDHGQTFTYFDESQTYRVEDAWGSGPYDPHRACIDVFEGPGDHPWILGRYTEWSPSARRTYDWLWAVNFNICSDYGGE